MCNVVRSNKNNLQLEQCPKMICILYTCQKWVYSSVLSKNPRDIWPDIHSKGRLYKNLREIWAKILVYPLDPMDSLEWNKNARGLMP